MKHQKPLFRVISFILTMALLLGMIPVVAAAAEQHLPHDEDYKGFSMENLNIANVETGFREELLKEHVGDSTKPISVFAEQSLTNPFASSGAGVKINLGDFLGAQLRLGVDDTSISLTHTDENTTYGLQIIVDLTEVELGIGVSANSKIPLADGLENEMTSSGRINITGRGLLMIILVAYGMPQGALALARR